MRAHKGLGRKLSSQIRIAIDAENARDVPPSPHHVRKANKLANSPAPAREAKVVVTAADVRSMAKMVGKRHPTAHVSRKLKLRVLTMAQAH